MWFTQFEVGRNTEQRERAARVQPDDCGAARAEPARRRSDEALAASRDWHGVCMPLGAVIGSSIKGAVMLKVLARAFFAAYLLCSTTANASWPDRPVTLIVPYAAGGITDVLARLTAEHLQRTFKQPFVIQNETGAGGIIGAANAARAKPDGHTLFFAPTVDAFSTHHEGQFYDKRFRTYLDRRL